MEDGCFHGDSLDKEEAMRGKSDQITVNSSESKTCSLLRGPSLPPNLGKVEEEGEEEEDDDDDGPRMGDLIRQAMPCNKLERAPSLPPCGITREAMGASTAVGIPRGPSNMEPMGKLTRRSSMDPSLIWPPKHSSKPKGMKQLAGSSVSRARNVEANKASKPRGLKRSLSLKYLSDKEVIGFQELGFTFDKEDLNSSVAAKLAGLEMKGPPNIMEGKAKRSPLCEAGNATDGSKSPPIGKWVDNKSSAEDMKAQIKFWARAVASNVQPGESNGG